MKCVTVAGGLDGGVHRQVWRSLVLAIALIGVGVSGAARACERLQEFDEITATISKEFYDHTFRGLDWPARVRAANYRGQVSCDSDERSLAAHINGLLSELHASHTGLYTAHDLEYWALESIFSRSLDKYPVAYSGFWPERHAGRWHAKYVLEGSRPADAGVRAGDQLVSVGGRAFEPLGIPADEISTLVISSDRQLRPERSRVRARTGAIRPSCSRPRSDRLASSRLRNTRLATFIFGQVRMSASSTRSTRRSQHSRRPRSMRSSSTCAAAWAEPVSSISQVSGRARGCATCRSTF